MPAPKCDVLCVGILVADIFAPPLPRLPIAGELLPVDDLLLQTGGCAANTGVDLARLGAKVAVVGKVGNDMFAGFIRQDLAAKGLDVSGISATASAPTSRTVILPVVGEDRRYIHAIGANAQLSAADIDLDAVAAARVLYVGGYQLVPGLSQQDLVRVFQHARAHGVKTMLDVAGVHADRGMEPFRDILPFTDLFLPNNDEARLITGHSDPRAQAQALFDMGVGTVVVTLGEKGVVARSREGFLQASAFRINVVDPSGGGDAFDAGFIIGMLEGGDLRRCIAFGSAIGASACTRLGCTAGVFDRAAADAFLAAPHPEFTIRVD